jgi:hypothetical protein
MVVNTDECGCADAVEPWDDAGADRTYRDEAPLTGQRPVPRVPGIDGIREFGTGDGG